MTIFTEIIEGKRPGFIIFEDENHVAILDKYPIDTGHSLVIPKKPYEKIIDMLKIDVSKLGVSKASKKISKITSIKSDYIYKLALKLNKSDF